MKRILILSLISLSVIGYAQVPIVLEDNQNQASSPSLTQDLLTPSSDTQTSNDPSQEKRTIQDVMEGDLIQVDPHRNQEASVDPYPLASYSGDLYHSVSEVQQNFTLENIKKLKASLETLKQSGMEPLGYLLLGNIYNQLKLYTQAIATYDEGLSQDKEPENQVIFALNKAQTLRYWNKNKEALETLSSLNTDQFGSKYPQIFFYSGLSSLYLNDAKRAIFFLRKYLELYPEAPQANNVKRAIAWLLFSMNNSGAKGSGGFGNYNDNEASKLLKALENQENALSHSLSTNVEDRELNIDNLGIEEGEEYSSIAD